MATIIDLQEQNMDRRTPEEKLETVSDPIGLFIFFQYYDGYSINGDIGFSESSKPPGSINHKYAFSKLLAPMTESKFCERGKALAELAREFVSSSKVPNPHLRPPFVQHIPISMIVGAYNAGS
eukprot:15366850-Ditylum_brightwellii.AAC.1